MVSWSEKWGATKKGHENAACPNGENTHPSHASCVAAKWKLERENAHIKCHRDSKEHV